MSEQQNHRCLLCEKKRFLVIDHCHETGVVRGLLCRHCNTAVGFFERTEPIRDKYLAYIASRREATEEDLRFHAERRPFAPYRPRDRLRQEQLRADLAAKIPIVGKLSLANG
jgi:hypothetical protein